ncbi:hypothetical protein [Stutzerimonas tarimensis]|uniref:Secreted protein n=1 Tax=Stutzerimonas tarimensis TaxID=1507735 RepID=A0ABV7T1S8_9GAMM
MKNMNLAALLLSGLLSGLAVADQPNGASNGRKVPAEQSAQVGEQHFERQETTDERVRQLMLDDQRESDDQRLEINP